MVHCNHIFHKALFGVAMAIFNAGMEVLHKFSCGYIDKLSENKHIRCANEAAKCCMGEIAVLLLSKEIKIIRR